MADVRLIITIIIVVIAIILVGISTAIDGILSTSKTGKLKTTLLGAAATGGFSVIFSIIAAIIFIMLLNARRDKAAPAKIRSLLIAFIVFISIALILYIVDIILNLVARGNDEMTTQDKTSVTAAIIIMAIGFIIMIVATILIYNRMKSTTVAAEKVVAEEVVEEKVTTAKVTTAKVVPTKVTTTKVVPTRVTTTKVVPRRVTTTKVAPTKVASTKTVTTNTI